MSAQDDLTVACEAALDWAMACGGAEAERVVASIARLRPHLVPNEGALALASSTRRSRACACGSSCECCCMCEGAEWAEHREPAMTAHPTPTRPTLRED